MESQYSKKFIQYITSTGGKAYDMMNVEGDSGTWIGPKSDWEKENGHKEIILKTVKNFKTALQCGGAFGFYSLLLSEMFEKVYTFEPTPTSFHCLVNNCQTDKIIKINAALGETHKMISIKENLAGNQGMNQVQDNGIIPMLMLDDFEFDSLDLLMLDVERYENQVIQGGLKNIEKFKPVIFAECGDSKTKKLLEPFGYKEYCKSTSDVVYVVE